MSICNRTQQECRNPQLCLAHGCPGTQPNYYGSAQANASKPPQPTHITEDVSRLREGANAIRARIKELRATHATELEYVQHRLRERDWHGLWDGAIGAAEWEIEITALEWCLGQLGQEV